MDGQQLALIAVLAVALIVVGLLGRHKGEETRSARMMKKYRVMTRETFDAIPDGELTDAVVSRVLGKAAESRCPEPVQVLAALEHGSTVVYSLWVVCREMASGSFSALMHSRSREMAELAGESFAAIGAPACEAAWKTLLSAGEADVPAAEQAFRQAVQTECPLTLCEAYIRDHAEEFIDEPADDRESDSTGLPDDAGDR